MVKFRHSACMIGIVLVLLFLVLCALAPLLTRAVDMDDRDRRGWWVNH
jgi:hypothetical protein